MKIKRKVYEFATDNASVDMRWEQLEIAIEKDSQDGWKPWAIETHSNFTTNYKSLNTLAVVWYRRDE